MPENDKSASSMMTIGMIGSMGTFIPGECFVAYRERVEQFILVNRVSDSMKTAYFIACVNDEVYKTLRTRVSPKKPAEMKVEEILDELERHYAPKVNIQAERFKFQKAEQYEGETINEYIVRLRGLAETCQFGSFIEDTVPNSGTLKNKALECALRDRFIVGIKDKKIQQMLLNKSEMKFEECCELAITAELSKKEQEAFVPRFQNFVVKKNRATGRIVQQKQLLVKQCRHCGRNNHREENCFCRDWTCFNCNKRGHTATVCRNPRKQSTHKVMGTSVNSCNQSLTRDVIVNGVIINMEIDTGCSTTLMSEMEFKTKLQDKCKLNTNVNLNLVTVVGNSLNVVGQGNVMVEIDGKEEPLELVIVRSNQNFKALLGRNWLKKICPGWEDIFQESERIKSVTNENFLTEIKSKYPELTHGDSKIAIKQYKAEIVVKNCVPIFHKAYTVPLRLRDKVEIELQNLVKNEILTPVKYSQWASPIVIVPKSDGNLRLCVDYGVTINKFIKTEHYPLPVIEDIFASLANCKVFCVLDLKGAYNQLMLTDKSKELLVINTHKGLYQFNRLPFGVSAAPAIFQSVMDQILNKIPKVFCYLDDIIIGGKSNEDCKDIVFEVLDRLNESKVQINLEKCKFLTNTVEYLGHVLEHNRVHPNPQKIEAIIKAPSPENVTQLQSFLGLLNYYRRFIPSLSTQLKDLYALLKKNIPFNWSSTNQKAFEKAKQLIVNNKVLELFDPEKQIIVSTDASPYGVGAVLSHIVKGEERPVLFASATLSPAEKNYSQLQREALAIIFAVKKFDRYLYGKEFWIYTDHQPLKELFNPEKNNHAVAAARLQRWAIILSSYKYKIFYRPGSKMGNADMLSRLPLPENTEIKSKIDVNFINYSSQIPLDIESIKENVNNDRVLKTIYKYTMEGWRKSANDSEIMPFQRQKNRIHTENGLLYYLNRIIIPKQLQKQIMKYLHENHMGMEKMKSVARSYVWWPNIDTDIEFYVNSCDICQRTRNFRREKIEGQWPKCTKPFERVHIDFFYFEGNEFLLIIDSFSKYLNIYKMRKTNAIEVIGKFEEFIAMFGLPREIVADNGPPFGSYEFSKFCNRHKIVLTHSPPYHPQSNGLAERNVQSVKKVLKKFMLTEERDLSVEKKLAKFLAQQRNTPNSMTRQSPNDIIFKYKPRTLLDILVDKTLYKRSNKHCMQREIVKSNEHDQSNVVNNNYKNGEIIYYKSYLNHCIKWIRAKFVRVVSRYVCIIEIENRWKTAHLNQIRKCNQRDQFPSNVYIFNEAVKKNNESVDNSVRRSSRIRINYSKKPINYKL